MFHFFKRKQPKKRDPLPSWAKWAVLAFIIYAVLTNPNRGKVVEPQQHTATPDVIGTASEKISEYKNVLNKFGVALRVEDTATGNGQPLLCGQDVTIAYEAFDPDGKPLGDSNQHYSFRFGEGKANRALEQGIGGMATGGKRTIFARNSLAYGDARKDIAADAMLKFEVELTSLSPNLSPLADAPYRVFDTAAGSGNGIVCGKPVKLMVTVWGVDGKKLYETKEPVVFTPGRSEVPLGIEQGVIGMSHGGARTLIIPPQLQKPMHGNKPLQAFSLPQPQTVIVDLSVN